MKSATEQRLFEKMTAANHIKTLMEEYRWGDKSPTKFQIIPVLNGGQNGGLRMSVKIYVRDNTNGKVHEYGTSQHDALILQDDGSLHYQNLQNGCGTIYPDEGYTFCEADGSDPRT